MSILRAHEFVLRAKCPRAGPRDLLIKIQTSHALLQNSGLRGIKQRSNCVYFLLSQFYLNSRKELIYMEGANIYVQSCGIILWKYRADGVSRIKISWVFTFKLFFLRYEGLGFSQFSCKLHQLSGHSIFV